MRFPSRKIQFLSALLVVGGVAMVFASEGWGDGKTLGTLAGCLLLSIGVVFLARAARRAQDGTAPSDLEQSPRTLARAQELARVGTWWYRPGTRQVRISAEHLSSAGIEGTAGVWEGFSTYLSSFVHPEDRGLLDAWISGPSRRDDADDSERICYRVICQDGRVRHLRAIWNDDGPDERLVAAQDITEQKALEEKLLRGVLYDPLTGLPNRTLFDDRLSSALRRVGPPVVGVALMDIDRFLAVNASLGRDSGDALLLGLAVRLVGILPPGVTVARVGEDEFAALLETGTAQEAVEIAHRMRTALESPLLRGTREVSLTACLGLATMPRDGGAAETILQRAETALFQARNLGGGSIAVFDEERGRIDREEVALELELRQATGHGELELHYQPVVRLADLATTGFEALVRWRRPGVGLVSPALFIPMAERTGSVHEIGLWVLEEGLRTLADWSRSGRKLTMAINLSARQMEEPDLVETIRQALARSGVNPPMVHLEITESALANRPAEAALRIEAIRSLGVKVSLDDFGTGFSSLGYLHRFPVDTLKIDKSFVDMLRGDGDLSPVPRAIVGLAQSLRMDVVAEGIEQESQLEQLRSMGCEFGQGFLFSKPRSRSDAEVWLLQHPSP